MATFDTNRPLTSVPTFGNRLSHLFALMTDWYERRQTRRTLLSLTDRELDDIGLCRGDIDRIA